MKKTFIAVRSLRRAALRAGLRLGERQPRGRVDAAQLRRDEPREPLGRKHEHAAGEGTEHTNAYGGNTAHAYGGGTEHTNVYGGSTYGKAGDGAYHTYPGGATAYHPPGYPAYPTYAAYHPPVAVPYYSSGCYGCAAAAGAVVGVAAGAAVASANTAAATSSAYNAGVAAGNANTAAATRRRTTRALRPVWPPRRRRRAGVRHLGDGHELRDGSGRMRDAQRAGPAVLPVRQHVVQAGLRRQWRVLHGGAHALTSRGEDPMSASVKERLLEEFKVFWVIAFYLWLFLGSFVL